MYDEETLNYGEILGYLDAAPANIFFKDAECKYRFATFICDAVNGGEEHSIIGKTDLEIQKFPDLGRLYYEDDKKILATGEGSEYISEFPMESGSLYYEINKQPVIRDGSVVGIVGVVNDVTKRVELEKQMKELAFHDQLTGLYNRNFLESRSHADVPVSDFPVSLIVADCNMLKEVNDTLGHEYGDLLLRRVADVLRESVPERCVCVRTGGDEFLVLCPGLNDAAAKALIGDLRQALAKKSDDILTLKVAFGCYSVVDDTVPFAEALNLADQAMYEDKRASRAGA